MFITRCMRTSFYTSTGNPSRTGQDREAARAGMWAGQWLLESEVGQTRL